MTALRIAMQRALQARPLTSSTVHTFGCMPRVVRSFQVSHAHDGNGSDEKAPVSVQPDKEPQPSPSPRTHRQATGLPSLYSSFFPSRIGSMFRQMEDEMNQLLQGFGSDVGLASPLDNYRTRSPGGVLAVDVQDREKEYVLTADLPGIPKEGVKVTVSPDNVLTISGERKQEKSTEEDGGFTRVERSYGSFQRSFRLPEHVDASGIRAKSDHGVLTLTLPKTEKEQQNIITVSVE